MVVCSSLVEGAVDDEGGRGEGGCGGGGSATGQRRTHSESELKEGIIDTQDDRLDVLATRKVAVALKVYKGACEARMWVRGGVGRLSATFLVGPPNDVTHHWVCRPPAGSWLVRRCGL